MDITEPLVLSRGSHQPGSGRGCAMNVIAWELGGKITDRPPTVHPLLARMVQIANDGLARPTIPQPAPRSCTSPAEWEERARAYSQSFEVPAEYALPLLDIAHETLDTKVGDREESEVLRDARDYPEAFPVYTRFKSQMSSGLSSEATLRLLAESVRDFRVELGLPEKRSTAPSVDAINDALRKMSVKA